MVGDILQPTHLLFVLVVALLVLGPKRLPEVARQLGNGLRDFRSAISGEDRSEHDTSNQVLTHPDDQRIDEHPDMSAFHGDHADTAEAATPLEHADTAAATTSLEHADTAAAATPVEHAQTSESPVTHEPAATTPQPVAPTDKPA